MTPSFLRSYSLRFRFQLFILLLCHSFNVSYALLNLTLDDTNTLIRFEPKSSWTRIVDDSNFDAGGSHMVTEDPKATATLTIAFSSVYFLAPSWPYAVSAQLSVGSSSLTVDLQDHSVPDLGVDSGAAPTIASRPAARILNGNYSNQTITISVPPGGTFAVFDMLIIQIPDDQPIPRGLVSIGAIGGIPSTGISTFSNTPTSTSSSSFPAATSTGGIMQPPAAPSGQKSGLLLAVALLIPTITILVAFVTWKYLAIRKKNKKKRRFISNIDPEIRTTIRSFSNVSSLKESPYGGFYSAASTPRSMSPSPYIVPLSPPLAILRPPSVPRIEVTAQDRAYSPVQVPPPVQTEKGGDLRVMNPPRFTMLSGVMTLSSPPSYLSTLGGEAGPSTSFSAIPPVPSLPSSLPNPYEKY